MQTAVKNNIFNFYSTLGIDGLSKLLTENNNKDYFDFITSSLISGNILDVGCGYGRLSIPLLDAGYDVEGVDIMNVFVDYANQHTSSNRFKQGDMLNLPYMDNSFDNAICLWSTFNHFLEIDDQMKVLLEINRVLKKNGKCIIDLPTPEIYKLPKLSEVVTSNATDNICNYTVNGIPNADYVHNESTLENLVHLTGITSYTIERVNIGNLPRLILTFYKK